MSLFHIMQHIEGHNLQMVYPISARMRHINAPPIMLLRSKWIFIIVTTFNTVNCYNYFYWFTATTTIKRGMTADSLSPISYVNGICYINGVCTVLIDSVKSQRHTQCTHLSIITSRPLAWVIHHSRVDQTSLDTVWPHSPYLWMVYQFLAREWCNIRKHRK